MINTLTSDSRQSFYKNGLVFKFGYFILIVHIIDIPNPFYEKFKNYFTCEV